MKVLSTSQASVQLAQFQEVANLLLSELSATSKEAFPPPISMSLSTMASPEQKISIRSTNVRVTLGVKDSAIETATTVLSRASSDISSFVIRDQHRWEQAIRARRAHWSMVPQHQALTPHFRRDESAIPRNFLISFSLEECLFLAGFPKVFQTDSTPCAAPPQFRRRSLVSFKDRAQSEYDDKLIFPSHPRRRLRVGLSRHLATGSETLAMGVIDLDRSCDQRPSTIERRLLRGQREVVEEEIFSLVRFISYITELVFTSIPVDS